MKSLKELIKDNKVKFLKYEDGKLLYKLETKDESYVFPIDITDRSDIINGGYVIENGITLCPECHILAEIFHTSGESYLNYSPEDLYKIINSSYEKAVKASEKLKWQKKN